MHQQPALAGEPKEAVSLRETSVALKGLLDQKEAFMSGLLAGDEAQYIKLPAQIPFTVFQKLEKNADPEFMEAAIDYAEASTSSRITLTRWGTLRAP